MPNNASARRVKDKKNKSKKGEGSKKTDTLSLPKEDAASVDSGTLPLSSAEKEQASKDKASALSLGVKHGEEYLEKALGAWNKQKDSAAESKAILDAHTLPLSFVGNEQVRQRPSWTTSMATYKRVASRSDARDLLRHLHQMEETISKHADDDGDASYGHNSWAASLIYEHTLAVTMEERLKARREFQAKCREDNPLISKDELGSLDKKGRLARVLEWRREVLQGEKNFLLSSSLSERAKEAELLVKGPAQSALLKEHALSLTKEESVSFYAEVRKANPMAEAKEIAKILKAAKVQAALAWNRNKKQERDGETFSVLLPERTKHTESLSLEAQSKSGTSTTVKHYFSLTAEERQPVKQATRLANPDADEKAFNKAFGVCCSPLCTNYTLYQALLGFEP